jgi:predicted nucleic acid-binding protein
VTVCFDTSVLVAGVLAAHPMHERAMCWIEAVHQQELRGLMTAHAVAELWAVLTRLPLASPLSGTMAEQIIKRLCRTIRPIALTNAHYTAAIRRCAERRQRSGAVFDALHLVAAEGKRCEALVTFNPIDFQRLANTDSPRIVVPPDPPSIRVS